MVSLFCLYICATKLHTTITNPSYVPSSLLYSQNKHFNWITELAEICYTSSQYFLSVFFKFLLLLMGCKWTSGKKSLQGLHFSPTGYIPSLLLPPLSSPSADLVCALWSWSRVASFPLVTLRARHFSGLELWVITTPTPPSRGSQEDQEEEGVIAPSTDHPPTHQPTHPPSHQRGTKPPPLPHPY